MKRVLIEYEMIPLPSGADGGPVAFIAELKNLGWDGWELCGMEYGYAFLKRQGEEVIANG